MKTLTPALSLKAAQPQPSFTQHLPKNVDVTTKESKGRGRNYSGQFFNDEMMNPFCDWIQFSLSSEERVEVRSSVASAWKVSASDRFHRKGSKRSK